jgi:hypothetical protein
VNNNHGNLRKFSKFKNCFYLSESGRMVTENNLYKEDLKYNNF